MTNRQIMILIPLFLMGGAFLQVPNFTAAMAEQDAWLVAVLGCVVAVAAGFLYGEICENNQGKNFLQIVESRWGVWAGRILGVMYVIYFFTTCALLLNFLSYFLKIILLRNTPLIALGLLFMFLICYAHRLGVTAVARTGEILFWMVIAAVIIFIIGLMPSMDPEQLLPTGFIDKRAIYQGLFNYAGYPLLEVAAFMFFAQHFDRPRARSFAKGMLIGSFILLIFIVAALLVYGPINTKHNAYATYSLVDRWGIGLKTFRVEALLSTVWLSGFFIKLTLLFEACSNSLAYVCRIAENRWLTAPTAALILFGVANLQDDVVVQGFQTTELWPVLAFVMGLLIPFALWVSQRPQRKKKVPKAVNRQT
ncbi:GerAB/ArcD/ProY family transporter [Paenibacillus sp. 481]|uniref:GerAB/ArcD/ProY family transporter n=1 Tax=Paenibacillus sp. 481 TaxID=2835869 RepID=UPI001E48F2DF|nr:endospore germination permease [Paenibacillus sp. 481]UHA75600.1 endospore germination permease [Paenibacillus sp. 481]